MSRNISHACAPLFSKACHPKRVGIMSTRYDGCVLLAQLKQLDHHHQHSSDLGSSCQLSIWFCLTFISCLFPTPIRSLRTSLPGELRIASYAPSPGWHVFLIVVFVMPAVRACVRCPDSLPLCHAHADASRGIWCPSRASSIAFQGHVMLPWKGI